MRPANLRPILHTDHPSKDDALVNFQASISDQFSPVADTQDRSQPGHWEGDVIVGPRHRSAIGTLVERHSRLVKLIYLPRPDSFELRDGLLCELAGLPETLLRSITWDQGSEMARHLEITAATGATVYFGDAGSPWQRGSNENTNRLLRQYFPKGSDLSVHSRAHLARVQEELNHRPRARPR